MYAIMCGTIMSGVSFYGPYDTPEEAIEVAESEYMGVWEIIKIEKLP